MDGLILREILNWCVENNVTDFSKLVDYAMDGDKDNWLPVVMSNADLIIEYLRDKKDFLVDNEGSIIEE